MHVISACVPTIPPPPLPAAPNIDIHPWEEGETNEVKISANNTLFSEQKKLPVCVHYPSGRTHCMIVDIHYVRIQKRVPPINHLGTPLANMSTLIILNSFYFIHVKRSINLAWKDHLQSQFSTECLNIYMNTKTQYYLQMTLINIIIIHAT